MKFKVGDKVIALTDPMFKASQFRVKGETYTVNAISYCPCCGIQYINIGQKATPYSLDAICRCKKIHHNDGLAWTIYDHFALADKQSLQNLEYEAVSNEDYESAALYRDISLKINQE